MSLWSTIHVPADGPADARILICGEAPGSKEEELGQPFVGAAGKVLDGVLADAGLDRKECYLTNLVKYRPKDNEFSNFYDRKEPLQILSDGIMEVKEEIVRTRPNVVVCLGAEPLKALTGKIGITKWRGSVLTCDLPDGTKAKVVATYHPAAVLRNWELRPISLFDMQRVKQEAVSPDVNLPQRTLVVNPSYNDIMFHLNRMKSSQYISFDIETETGQITCIGLSDSPTWAICIPFWYASSGSLWSVEQETCIWGAIKEVLEGPVPKIAQNAQYDMTWLADLMGIEVKPLFMDTMIAGHLCYPELPKGLDFLTSIYTKQPYYKDMIRSDDAVEYWQYNALDACCTYEVAFEVQKELKELGMWSLYTDYVHQLIYPLMDMARRGVKIDLPLRKLAIKNYHDQVIELQRELNELVGHELNVGSPKQMQKWLYEEIGFKAKYKRREGNGSITNTVTADEEAIRELARTSPRREFDLVLDIRGLKKVLSTYLEAPLDEDGRIRTTYLITGTETGRLSSRESVYGTGTNLQNVPKGIARRLFVPDGENIFVSGDLSQAEARVVAYLAGEDTLIRMFETGGDIHRRNAAAIFRVPEASVTDKQRQLAKRVVHASNYGMGPLTFAKQAGISLLEAKRLLNAYFATYPGIKLWQMKTAHTLNKTRFLTTPFGRKRLFLGTMNESLLKESYAYVPQSTVSDILNTGLLKLYNSLKNEPWCRADGEYDTPQLLLQVHDSVVIQGHYSMTAPMCEFMLQNLTVPVEIKGIDGQPRVCIIPVDMQIGWNWDEMVKIARPFDKLPERKVGINAT